MTETSAFWTFSLGVYSRPGVPGACLALQDQCGADVNVALYMTWLGTLGRRLKANEVEEIVELVEPWRTEVVVPLRGVRRFVKSPLQNFPVEAIAALRTRVKQIELEAERLQQETLYSWRPTLDLGAADEPRRASRENLALYAQKLGTEFPRPQLDVILSAAFPTSRVEGASE